MSKLGGDPVANGLRTDHPVPGLPFVDDAHIPVTDAKGIESVGRHSYQGYWGREDSLPNGAWVAYTTDPLRTDLAWVVRFHPAYGRSVLLYRDEDAPDAHVAHQGPAMLFRFGGYSWDGDSWYRPLQLWDGASEDYLRRPVPWAATIAASDVLPLADDTTSVPAQQILDFDPLFELGNGWGEHLQGWADSRRPGTGLSTCVVNLEAPELAPSQLLGIADVARLSGFTTSYLQDGVATASWDRVPHPQSLVEGKPVWARVVVQEWLEQLDRSGTRLGDVVAAEVDGTPVPPAIADILLYFQTLFLKELGGDSFFQSLRRRPKRASLAKRLSWRVARQLDQVVNRGDVATCLRYAVLHQLGVGRTQDKDMEYYGLVPAIARQLDWLIRTDPERASVLLQEIVGQAERELEVPRAISIETLRVALRLDGKLADEQRAVYLARLFCVVAEGARPAEER